MFTLSAPLSASNPRKQFEMEVLALRPHLYKYARRFVRSTNDRDDLVQETIAKALVNHERFEPGRALGPWLFRIMRNQFIDDFHQRKREPHFEDEASGMPISTGPTQDWNLYVKDAAILLGNMPDHIRTAVLDISCGASYQDTAVKIGCEIATLKTWVGRARKSMRANMGDIFQSTFSAKDI